MMFLFASMANNASGWPVQAMHQTEQAFIITAFGSLVLGVLLRGMAYQMFALIGGIAAGFGLVMPFELAPFFFGSRGEIMLGTIGLILVYPVAIVVFIWLYAKILRA